LVIGADQVLECDGVLFDKPVDLAAARAQLLALRGRTHRLVSAVVLARDGQRAWHHVDRADLTMRDFSAGFLDHYLESSGDAVLSSVGAYQLEGRGVQLFVRIDGDYFSILGLPLLPLLDILREQGVLPSLSRIQPWQFDAERAQPHCRRDGLADRPFAFAALHGYWLRTYGIDGAYIPLPVRSERFAAALRALPMLGFAGVNVTVPHKEAALAAVDRSDPAARRIRRRQHDRGWRRTEPLMAATAMGSGSWRTCARVCRLVAENGTGRDPRRRRRGSRRCGRFAGRRRSRDSDRKPDDQSGRTPERGYRWPIPRLRLGRPGPPPWAMRRCS
jgi:hypothetical protein